jgi:hypothetical protein
MLLSGSILSLLPVLAFVNVVVAFLLALGQGDRIYEWWLRGYPDYVPGQGIAKSGPKGSLKERLHAWWMSGYQDEHLPGEYSVTETLEQGVLTLEREGGTVEHTLEQIDGSLEQKNVEEEPRVLTLEQPSQTPVLTSKKPSREDFDILKRALGVEKGSLQYKARGDGIYLVTYNRETKGRDWTLVGTWSDLKNLIYQEALPKVAVNSDVRSIEEA